MLLIPVQQTGGQEKMRLGAGAGRPQEEDRREVEALRGCSEQV
jgi:hypothetical protein